MSHGKQFTLYSNRVGPNGWKVAAVMNELGLTFETIFLSFEQQEHKSPEVLALNPNGRIPIIIDHQNNDYVLWESGAILLYLVDRYDKERRLTITNDEDRYKFYQFIFYQVSGQGPYFGQASWFRNYHHEKLPSAIERYRNETMRILGTLEKVLSTQDWLVGVKMTIADIIYTPWTYILPYIFGNDSETIFHQSFPSTYGWNQRLLASPGVKKALDEYGGHLKKGASQMI